MMDISIKMTIEQWNQVLDMLSDAPVKKAMGLINEIVRQAKEQMPQSNGLDTTSPTLSPEVVK